MDAKPKTKLDIQEKLELLVSIVLLNGFLCFYIIVKDLKEGT